MRVESKEKVLADLEAIDANGKVGETNRYMDDRE